MGTLGQGRVAIVDTAGRVIPKDRGWMLALWFGDGQQWVGPGHGAAVRSRRVDGLPVIECRSRLGDGDVVWTVAADEDGPVGRVLIEIENEGDAPITCAVAVSAQDGKGVSARVSGERIVVGRTPAVELGRLPGDVVIADGDDLHAVLEATSASTHRPSIERAVDSKDGGGLAALIPIVPGSARTIRIVHGREPERTVAPPIERVVDGWGALVGRGAHVALPGWPTHLWPALVSGVALEQPTVDDVDEAAAVLAALAVAGADETSVRSMLDEMLDDVLGGRLRPDRWAPVGAALALAARLDRWPSPGLHDIAATVLAATIERMGGALVPDARAALIALAGPRAGADAAAIEPRPSEAGRLASTILGQAEDGRAAPIHERLRLLRDPLAALLGAGPASRLDTDPIVAIRAAAGATWSWATEEAGDDPMVRAVLILGIRRLVLREVDDTVWLAPGIHNAWLGRSVDVTDLPISGGERISYSIRWHGARPAVLWEIDGDRPRRLCAPGIDPSFESTDHSGEILLAAPEWAEAPS